MPELPEVETVVRDLNRKVKNRRIVDFWTDWPKYFRLPKTEKAFKKCVIKRNIVGARRRGKNILIELSGGHLLLIHQKMTGHLLYGKWKKNNNILKDNTDWEGQKWIPDPLKGKLTDPKNKYIRLIFFLDNEKMLALSDLRRFAKVLCGPKEKILASPDLKDLGPEPLELTFAQFKELFIKKGRIKQVLMDQNFIVGIGNIYSDEILYLAKIHPLSRAEKLKENHLKAIYRALKSILTKAIKARGTSIDDFRDTSGTKGRYGRVLLVYQKTGKKCPHGHTIERLKIGGRSAHFCPKEQKLYT